MLQKRAIKLRGQLGLNSTEAQWVKSLRDSGMSKAEIIRVVTERDSAGADMASVLVDYYLGNLSSGDLMPYLSPKQPTSIQLQGPVDGGYLLRTFGDDAEYYVLLLAPNLAASDVLALLKEHQESFCWLAYKNAYEGVSHQLESGDAATPITLDEIRPLLSN